MEIPCLSEDLIITILSKLPVKSIIRFKCVSKSWYKIIESPIFIDTHLNRNINCSSKYDNKDHLALFTRNRDTQGKFFSFVSSSTFKFSSSLSTQCLGERLHGQIDFINACDGLMIFLVDGKHFYVANPATREFKAIKEPNNASHWLVTSYGFGFDPKSKDYKLVRITNEKVKNKVDVFTLRNNTWRSLADSDVMVDARVSIDDSVVLNNSLHWKGSKAHEIETKIFAFDLGDEVFRAINLSPAVPCGCFCRVVVSKGCLSLAVESWWHQNDKVIDLWVMKEYGVEEWTKLYSLTLSHFINHSLDYAYFYKWHGIGINGEVIVSCGDHLFFLSPLGRDKFDVSVLHLELPTHSLYSVSPYRESLIPLEDKKRRY